MSGPRRSRCGQPHHLASLDGNLLCEIAAHVRIPTYESSDSGAHPKTFCTIHQPNAGDLRIHYRIKRKDARDVGAFQCGSRDNKIVHFRSTSV